MKQDILQKMFLLFFIDFNKKKLKRDTIGSLNALYEIVEKWFLMLLVLKSETFPLQPTEGTINPGMSVRVPRVSGR